MIVRLYLIHCGNKINLYYKPSLLRKGRRGGLHGESVQVVLVDVANVLEFGQQDRQRRCASTPE